MWGKTREERQRVREIEEDIGRETEGKIQRGRDRCI
jgi:hypothetical protein